MMKIAMLLTPEIRVLSLAAQLRKHIPDKITKRGAWRE
jgi:hypothetical protein